MKLLNAPYGWPKGRGFVLFTTSGAFDHDAVATVLLEFGCHPPVVPKILDCLEHSGRYECRLQHQAAEAVDQAREPFAQAGLGFFLEPAEVAAANWAEHRRLCAEQRVPEVPFTRERVGIPLIEHGANGGY